MNKNKVIRDFVNSVSNKALSLPFADIDYTNIGRNQWLFLHIFP